MIIIAEWTRKSFSLHGVLFHIPSSSAEQTPLMSFSKWINNWSHLWSTNWMEISQDLRQRVVQAYENKEGGMRRISKRFSIGLSTMKRLLKLKKETGDIKPRAHGGGTTPKVPDSELPKLTELVAEKPDRTTTELRIEWEKRTGVILSHASMIRALQRARLTFKKNVSSSRTRFRKQQNKTRIFWNWTRKDSRKK